MKRNKRMGGQQILSWRPSIPFITLIGIMVAVTACTEPTPPTHQAPDSLPAAEPVFTTPTVALPLATGEPVLFGIKSCKVYKSSSSGGAPENWTLLFEPAPYPLPQQCVRERLEFDGEYIQIEIGTQALGAGGCCTSYAAYRSRDGENWEVRPATSITEWQVLE
ncbi:hypothetical protein WNY37_05735 [Henriciella sp. AS95]|uniref:hypothetical protein n=1 Tax=Henriciella sp. AS95 TaxID=3135782 RepID=UPI00317AE7A9